MESKGTHLRICILLDHYKEGDPSHDFFLKKKNCIMYLRIFVLSLNSSFFIRRKKNLMYWHNRCLISFQQLRTTIPTKARVVFCLFV